MQDITYFLLLVAKLHTGSRSTGIHSVYNSSRPFMRLFKTPVMQKGTGTGNKKPIFNPIPPPQKNVQSIVIFFEEWYVRLCHSHIVQWNGHMLPLAQNCNCFWGKKKFAFKPHSFTNLCKVLCRTQPVNVFMAVHFELTSFFLFSFLPLQGVGN